MDFDDCEDVHVEAKKEDELSGKLKMQSFIPKGKGAEKIIRVEGKVQGPVYERGDTNAGEALTKAQVDQGEKDWASNLGFTMETVDGSAKKKNDGPQVLFEKIEIISEGNPNGPILI